MKRTKSPKKKVNKEPKNNKVEDQSKSNEFNNGHGTEHPLTNKQRTFIEEYLKDLNATQAAIRAGYSKNTAAVAGYENLRKPYMRTALEKRMRERERRTEITQDMVVRELARLAFSDMSSFACWGPAGVSLIRSSELTEEETAAVAELSQAGQNTKFKLHDKKAALELLGKHLGMFSDTVKHVGEDGGPISHEHNITDETIEAAYNTLYKR